MGQRGLLALLWSFARPHRWVIARGLVLLCLAAVVDVVSVLVMADVLNAVLEAHSTSQMVVSVASWVGVTALGAVLTYFGTIACTRGSEGVVLALRDAMFRRAQGIPLDELKRWSIGDLVVRLTEDVIVLETALSSSVVQAIIAGLTTLGLVGVAFYMSWQLTVVALIAVPILMGISLAFRGVQERVTISERTSHSALGGSLNEILSTHEHVRLHNMEGAESGLIHRRGVQLFLARMREARVEAAFGGILGSAEVLTMIVVTVGGVILVREGHLSIGSLIALSGYLAYLYPKIQEISETRLALVGAAVSADRILEVVGDLSDDESAGPHPGRVRAADSGPVAVTAAGVQLRRSDAFTLRVAEFAAAPGTVTVITGPSGSGKSTFGALVAGMERPDSGSLLLAGRDESAMSGGQIRAAVTLVPQRAVIRSGTIGENIGYGAAPDSEVDGDTPGGSGSHGAVSGAADEVVRAAARVARADEFVDQLPDGYGTEITLGGPELSGGQRQRIALARAIARDTPVVIFDEPSTGLDKENTELLARSLRALAVHRTVLVITHDPILVAAADSVYQADRGVIRPADREHLEYGSSAPEPDEVTGSDATGFAGTVEPGPQVAAPAEHSGDGRRYRIRRR
ncbi:ABC transporter ATP-binding protein [Tsukamurella soli]|uniref:ABC transporter ATP-binding protein n=1 Tax=Tsukamurella soli TaxID=644556 RepID=A0ABP8K0I7_9ACTN